MLHLLQLFAPFLEKNAMYNKCEKNELLQDRIQCTMAIIATYTVFMTHPSVLS